MGVLLLSLFFLVGSAHYVMKTALWVFMTIGAWLTFNEPAVRENWHWQQEFTGN
jgi:hypothetical protein